jgi:hypothetical protein
MSTVDEYRAKADKCRKRAEKTVREADKAGWLQIAEQWLKLAHDVEKKRPSGRLIPKASRRQTCERHAEALNASLSRPRPMIDRLVLLTWRG